MLQPENQNECDTAAPSVAIAPRNPAKGVLNFVVTLTTHKDVRSYPCRSMESAIKLVERFIAGVTKYANPASAIAHFAGIPRAIAAEKRRLAEALGAESGDQLVITSGATESNNLAILGAAKANPDRNHIIISAIEHPSVLEPAEALQVAETRSNEGK
jgi:hypothetical protein